MQITVIRQECLAPAHRNWQQPNGDEIKEALRLAGFSSTDAAEALGLSKSGRNVRKWITQDVIIPYAAWALLCNFAGLGLIWRSNDHV